MTFRKLIPLAAACLLAACSQSPGDADRSKNTAPAQHETAEAVTGPDTGDKYVAYAKAHIEDYVTVTLDADLSGYSEQQRRMIAVLIKASKVMNGLFWRQTWGDKSELMAGIDSPAIRRFVEINYGPWDRLNGNKPFVPGIGPKPAGANFYPEDMSRAEFKQADIADKASLYTLIRRNDRGQLISIPYHVAYAGSLQKAADLLRKAADLAEHPGFRRYLRLRAEALVTDEYRQSDLAWMDMRGNPIGLIIGAIEVYEDRLFGYKAAYEAYVLLKDRAWSERLERLTQYLPELQNHLPVPPKYKQEEPGGGADLNVYEVIYYAGQSNAGPKTIAINLPNSEYVQLHKGTRRLQLKNAMRAKFEKILVPISNVLIAGDQRQYITFNAFFQNTMFHEIAHGLGLKHTITGKGTVQEALREHYSALEEGKADILGLYMIKRLREKGVITEGRLMDNYVTFMASIFRSVRFGATDAHGVANMVRFNYFKEREAFTRDPETGTYRVNREKFEQAMKSLARKILMLQGNGDYEAAGRFLETYGRVGPQLARDLERLAEANIPVDVVFEQGIDVLGLGEVSR